MGYKDRMPRPGSRDEIIDAAERALLASGPAAIRQQQVAEDAGVASPTVLHHFDNRDHLIQVVIDRAIRRLREERLEQLARGVLDTYDMTELLGRVMASLADPAQARMRGRLACEAVLTDDPTAALGSVGAVLHARREAETGAPQSQEDTVFALVLASLALGAEPIVGKETWDSAGLGGDPGASARFRAWLFELLATHLQRPREAAVKTNGATAKGRRRK